MPFPGLGTILKWHCTIVKTKQVEWSAISLYLRYGLPFLNYVFQVECSFKIFPLCRSIDLLPGSGIALSKIISDDSELMVACKNGNLFTVKELFRKSKGRPDDISIKNMTPMLVSKDQKGSIFTKLT